MCVCDTAGNGRVCDAAGQTADKFELPASASLTDPDGYAIATKFSLNFL